ncbi:MAG: DUF302 domain-containing protein [Nitriliruptor sp.]|uniref:DUF302 domain-containing protein n=1 Tax=Nitriliruptor sp. TaxID=2448056 RepID=UPI0034A03303
MSGYTMTVTIDAEPVEAEALVRDALQAQGFGILSEIDVEGALRDKLGEEVGAYKILGACNPPLAKQAIDIDPDVGALLPCNVLLRANPAGGTDVVAADPHAMMALGPAALEDVATDARTRLDAALTALAEGGAA